MPPKKVPFRTKKAMVTRTSLENDDDKDNDNSDEEEEGSTKSGSPKVSADVQEQLVNDCVYYLLIANQKGYPLKKTGVVKHVVKDHPRMFAVIFIKAKQILNDVFGLNLVEVQNKKGHYLLINKLDFGSLDSDDEEGELPSFWSDTQHAHYGLLMLILSVIFMNGNVLTETVMWQFLKKLGLDVETDQFHPLFGNIKNLVTKEFVRKLYLEYKMIHGSEPPIYEFRWGPRAFLETSKVDMLNLMSNLYENIHPKDWTAQYEDAMEEEQSRAGTSQQ